MRKITSFLIALVAMTFTGCLDNFEELTIAQDGTGTYRSTMDMSGMFDMLEMIAAMDTSAATASKKLADKDFDSTLNFSDLIKEKEDLKLTEEQRELMKNAQMRFTMKQKDRVFSLGMIYPFKKIEDVEKIMKINREQNKGLNLLGDKKGMAGLPAMEDDTDMGAFTDFFDMTVKDGLIERRIDLAKVKEMKKGKMGELGQAEDMLEKMTFKTVINLPRPAKMVQGAALKLSDDKRSVTISSTMVDILNDPAKLAFRIEY